MPDPAYPGLLAKGVTATDIPGNFDLYAGEADIVTDQITTAGTPLDQFEVYALDEAGRAVPWAPAEGAATGTLTFSGVGEADDTVTINGHVITLVAEADPDEAEVTIGASAAETAQSFKAYVNAHQDETGVAATGDAAVLTLTALVSGEGGNNIDTTEDGDATAFGAAKLAGGSDESESLPVGIAAQPIAANSDGPAFTGGIFNHEALKWPATVTTLAARKAAFARTNIGVRQLL